MKFRIKNYRNRMRLRMTEILYILQKRLNRSWEHFVEKGHEKMTIMFIPHNEKRIFNFQISKFTISFFMFLFLVIVVTSSYAFIRNAAIKREEHRLLMTYRDIRSDLVNFEQLTNSVADTIDDLKPEIEELYELAAGTDDTEQLWNMSDMEGDILPGEIFTIRDIQKDIVCTTNTIKTIKNFIDVRSKVIKDTPSIVSNSGHITSLFGWRRSPFGHGRDFHTGIDIAAASGTVVRATAPGRVVSSGWGGGYGKMIRVRHKYGFETIYGHCKGIVAHQGDTVKKGQIIGYVGMTGNATGNHCHYEIRLGGVPINPYPYMSRIW